MKTKSSRSRLRIAKTLNLLKLPFDNKIGIPDFEQMVKDELNVKNIEYWGGLAEFDTNLTDELIGEGYARDFIRIVQDARKKHGLDLTHRIFLSFSGDQELERHINSHQKEISEKCLVVGWKSCVGDKKYEIDGRDFSIKIECVQNPELLRH